MTAAHRRALILGATALAVLGALGYGVLRHRPPWRTELIVCGGDEVFIVDLTRDRSPPPRIWAWRAVLQTDLPPWLIERFATTDECKPVAGGRQILITSADGGVALVERSTRRTLFHAEVPNAHSAEMLPRGRLVVSGSVAAGGNCLDVFDLSAPGARLCRERLRSAHGVVWDATRKRLWALGFDELRAYALRDWQSAQPSLAREQTYKLPGLDGHDLQPVPGSAALILTTGAGVWFFDRDGRTFHAHPVLGSSSRVKSVAIHPRSGRLAYVEAEDRTPWASRIRLLEPARTLRVPGVRIYKARWNVVE